MSGPGTRGRRQRDEGSRRTLAVTLPAYSGERPSGKVTTGWGHHVAPCPAPPCLCLPRRARRVWERHAPTGQRNAAQYHTAARARV